MSSDGWHWDLGDIAGLAAARAELRRHTAAQDPAEVTDHLLLAFDEMASNALRHGRAPVVACVRELPAAWLVEVQDAATTDPPLPAVGRDPAHGGLGLYLIVDLSVDHGWTADAHTKSVWAVIPRRRG